MNNILLAFGLNPENYHATPFGSGLINTTWKVSRKKEQYVLQQINKNVFKFPQDIDTNLVKLENYLSKTAPDYLLAAPLPALNSEFLVADGGE